MGQSAAEHATDAGVDDVEIMVPESEVDMNAELGGEVGVELSFAVPAVVAHASIGGLGAYGISQFADADIETGIDTQAAVEDAQIDIDVAIDLGAHHESATRLGVGSEHLLRCLAGLLGLVDISTLHAALALAVEEVGDVGGDGRQFAVVGQLVADAEVHVGPYLDADDARVEVDEGELAALLEVRFTEVDVPSALIQFLAVLHEGDLQVEADAGADAGVLGLEVLGLVLLLLRFAGALAGFYAHGIRQSGLGTLDGFLVLGIEFGEV